MTDKSLALSVIEDRQRSLEEVSGFLTKQDEMSVVKTKRGVLV